LTPPPPPPRRRRRQLFSMPTTGKLLAVLAVAVPVLLVGGLAYKAAMKCSWEEVRSCGAVSSASCHPLQILMSRL
jgi:hypothetical protein